MWKKKSMHFDDYELSDMEKIIGMDFYEFNFFV